MANRIDAATVCVDAEDISAVCGASPCINDDVGG